MFIKVACGTDDGKTFTGNHFGDSKYFLIYELGQNGFSLKEKRENKSPEEKEHGNPKKAESISELLKDVDVIMSLAMGPNIVRMRKSFIPAISRIVEIEAAMKKLQRIVPKLREEMEKFEKEIIYINDEKAEPTKETVMETLREVVDPELNISIVDLGLVYGVDIDDEKIKIKFTFTSPACPLGAMMISSIKFKIEERFGTEPEVELVFDPPWTPDRMADETKRETGFGV